MKNTDTSALDRALLAEIADRTARMQNNDQQAAAMASIMFNGDIPEDAPVLAKRQPAKQPNYRLSLPTSSNSSNYVELPPDLLSFVQEQTACKHHDVNIGFSTAADYFRVLKELNAKAQSLPTRVPVPTGWVAEYTGKNSHVDVADLLNGTNQAARHPEMLMELVRWACTVQREYEAADTRSALSQLEQRGKAADARLCDSAGTALLNKFNTLIALLQTPAFSGKPELLVQCLLSDWEWMQAGVAYKTPLSALSGSPALFDSERMQPACFIRAGSLSEFAQLHSERLIDEYRAVTSLRDRNFGTVSVQYAQKHSWVNAERAQFEAGAPVVIELGYQEQLSEGSSMDKDGYHDSYRDNTALTLVFEDGSLKIKPGTIPASSPVAEPVQHAVKALQLLDAEGK